ncbi:hypothetical protein APHCRT_1184 [Anaplasma phagocytophilum str. CRT53-1]|uniref:Uncharacterized protein n=1 Tax=Anaplasma phagocytophilum str. CRT53-1 TaxID=1359157 RepID=A0A0F3PU88_ANAPH|nr:hypothetical protein APHCRT_1184 [Anaplasma phagocytophilum str. CRT53-1]
MTATSDASRYNAFSGSREIHSLYQATLYRDRYYDKIPKL